MFLIDLECVPNGSVLFTEGWYSRNLAVVSWNTPKATATNKKTARTNMADLLGEQPCYHQEPTTGSELSSAHQGLYNDILDVGKNWQATEGSSIITIRSQDAASSFFESRLFWWVRFSPWKELLGNLKFLGMVLTIFADSGACGMMLPSCHYGDHDYELPPHCDSKRLTAAANDTGELDGHGPEPGYITPR